MRTASPATAALATNNRYTLGSTGRKTGSPMSLRAAVRKRPGGGWGFPAVFPPAVPLSYSVVALGPRLEAPNLPPSAREPIAGVGLRCRGIGTKGQLVAVHRVR